jgi:hypothetical protein
MSGMSVMGSDPGPTFASSPWDTRQEAACDGSKAVEAHALAEEEHRPVIAEHGACCGSLPRAHAGTYGSEMAQT